MKRSEISNIFPEATEDQIKQLLTINGNDINHAKSGLDELQSQLDTANEEIRCLKEGPTAEKLQAEKDRADNLQSQLDALQKADSLRAIRDKVSGEKKVPAHLLTAETEEDCIKQAEAILAFANPDGYPPVEDGGSPNNTGKTGLDAAWASLAKKISE